MLCTFSKECDPPQKGAGMKPPILITLLAVGMLTGLGLIFTVL